MEYKPEEITRKIVVAALLGNCAPPNEVPRNNVLRIKLFIKSIENEIGEEAYQKLLPEASDIIHMIVNRLFDIVCNTDTHEMSMISDMQQRLSPGSVDFVRKFCEKMINIDGKNQNRWHPALYKIKTYVESMTVMSGTGVTLKEFREAYFLFVHRVIDDIYKVIFS